jgi:serine/threonine protein kinase
MSGECSQHAHRLREVHQVGLCHPGAARRGGGRGGAVAVKLLPAHLAEDSDRRARFEREARVVSGLNHPHICTLHDIGQQDGIDYIVLEYLEGETFAERLAKGPLPLDQALRLAAQIADALDKAHRAGIVHRDLKPGNVVLTKAGAKLLDFGLARVGDVDGVAESQASLIAAILEKQPEPISAVPPMTPPALDRPVRRCLAKDPDDRWQSAADVTDGLKWIEQGGGAAAIAAGRGTGRRWLSASPPEPAAFPIRAATPWPLIGLRCSESQRPSHNGGLPGLSDSCCFPGEAGGVAPRAGESQSA